MSEGRSSGVLTGIAMLAAGLLRLGAVVRFVPNAVLTAFINAVALNIILAQLSDFTGTRVRRGLANMTPWIPPVSPAGGGDSGAAGVPGPGGRRPDRRNPVLVRSAARQGRPRQRSRSASPHQAGGVGCGSSSGLVCEEPCTGGAASFTFAWRAMTASLVTLKTVRSWVTVTGPP